MKVLSLLNMLSPLRGSTTSKSAADKRAVNGTFLSVLKNVVTKFSGQDQASNGKSSVTGANVTMPRSSNSATRASVATQSSGEEAVTAQNASMQSSVSGSKGKLEQTTSTNSDTDAPSNHSIGQTSKDSATASTSPALTLPVAAFHSLKSLQNIPPKTSSSLQANPLPATSSAKNHTPTNAVTTPAHLNKENMRSGNPLRSNSMSLPLSVSSTSAQYSNGILAPIANSLKGVVQRIRGNHEYHPTTLYSSGEKSASQNSRVQRYAHPVSTGINTAQFAPTSEKGKRQQSVKSEKISISDSRENQSSASRKSDAVQINRNLETAKPIDRLYQELSINSTQTNVVGRESGSFQSAVRVKPKSVAAETHTSESTKPITVGANSRPLPAENNGYLAQASKPASIPVNAQADYSGRANLQSEGRSAAIRNVLPVSDNKASINSRIDRTAESSAAAQKDTTIKHAPDTRNNDAKYQAVNRTTPTSQSNNGDNRTVVETPTKNPLRIIQNFWQRFVAISSANAYGKEMTQSAEQKANHADYSEVNNGRQQSAPRVGNLSSLTKAPESSLVRPVVLKESPSISEGTAVNTDAHNHDMSVKTIYVENRQKEKILKISLSTPGESLSRNGGGERMTSAVNTGSITADSSQANQAAGKSSDHSHAAPGESGTSKPSKVPAILQQSPRADRGITPKRFWGMRVQPQSATSAPAKQSNDMTQTEPHPVTEKAVNLKSNKAEISPKIESKEIPVPAAYPVNRTKSRAVSSTETPQYLEGGNRPVGVGRGADQSPRQNITLNETESRKSDLKPSIQTNPTAQTNRSRTPDSPHIIRNEVPSQTIVNSDGNQIVPEARVKSPSQAILSAGVRKPDNQEHNTTKKARQETETQRAVSESRNKTRTTASDVVKTANSAKGHPLNVTLAESREVRASEFVRKPDGFNETILRGDSSDAVKYIPPAAVGTAADVAGKRHQSELSVSKTSNGRMESVPLKTEISAITRNEKANDHSNSSSQQKSDSPPSFTQRRTSETAHVESVLKSPGNAEVNRGISETPKSNAAKSTIQPVAGIRETRDETAAITTESRTDTPPTAASSAMNSIRTLSASVSNQTPPLRPHFSADQIRELQEMAARALESSRFAADGSADVQFSWQHESLGMLEFRFSTRKEDVSVEISSANKDIADMLDESRPAVERAIADLGLRIERFEVRHKTADIGQDPDRSGFQPQRNSEQKADPDQQSFSWVSDNSVTRTVEDAPSGRPVLADHEWVA